MCCCKDKDSPDPGSNAALAVQKPRKNGWSWPLHPFQLVAWFFIAYFGVIHFGVLVPVMPAEWQIAGYIIVGIFLALHCILHIWSLTVNPADDNVIRKWKGLEPKKYDRTMQAHVIENNRCYICDTDVCASAKHCRLCNKCVSGFDHHCRWLNSCIGDKNYKLFISCLVSALVGAVLILAISIYVTVMYFVDPSALHYAQQDKYYLFAEVPGEAFVSIVILTSLLCVVAMLLLGHLLCFHLYLKCRGMSTYDRILETRKAMEEQEEEIRVLKELGYYEEKNLRYFVRKIRKFFASCVGGCLAVLAAAFISGPRRCFKHACSRTFVLKFLRKLMCCCRKSGRVESYEDMERGEVSSSNRGTRSREKADRKPRRNVPFCVVTCCQINVVHPDPNGQVETSTVDSAKADTDKGRGSPAEGSLASGTSSGTTVSKTDSANSQSAARGSPRSGSNMSEPDRANYRPARESPSSGATLPMTVNTHSQPAALEGPSYLVRSGKPYPRPKEKKSLWNRLTCLCTKVCNSLSTYDYIMRGREKAKQSSPESSQQNLKGNKVAPVAMISREQGLHESMENGYVPENGYHHGSYDPNSSDEDTRQMQRQYEEVLMEDEALSPRLTARSSGRHHPKSSERERQDSDIELPKATKMPRQLPPLRPVANLVQETTQVAPTNSKKKRQRRAKEQSHSDSVASERKKHKRNGTSKEKRMEVAAIAANGTYTPRGYHINPALPPITPPAPPPPMNDVITPARSPSPYHSSSAESLHEIPLDTIRSGYDQLALVRNKPQVIPAGASPNGSPNFSARDQEKRSHSKRRKAKPKERRPRPLDVPPLELTQTVTDGEYSIRSDVTTAQSGRPLPVMHMATSNV
ncbi:uncharacterized protein LOC144879610 isoform X3 [Branchiostoma floridae x Branchiostoma japonicum]